MTCLLFSSEILNDISMRLLKKVPKVENEPKNIIAIESTGNTIWVWWCLTLSRLKRKNKPINIICTNLILTRFILQIFLLLSQGRQAKLAGEDMNCQMPPGKSRLSCVRDSLCGCHYSTFLLFQSARLQATLPAWMQRDVILPSLGTSHPLPGRFGSTVPMGILKWKGRNSCKHWCFFMCLWIFRKINWAQWH